MARQPADDALRLVDEQDLDPLLERIGDARYVLLGEASHGTHEYYAWRSAITRRLLQEKGFAFVAVEGDWPDCHRVSCSVTLAAGAPQDPLEALRGFDRWPAWMWANGDVVEFTRWLRERNAGLPVEQRAGFYGLDVYSLWDSLRATLEYLQEHHPDRAEAAREAFRCLEPYAQDPQSYARATRLVPQGCEAEVVDVLRQLRAAGPPGADGGADGASEGASDGGNPSRDARFDAEQNALVAAGAEAYYRAMVQGGPQSWNVRDRHMLETLERLVTHHGDGARAVVWAHNTHVGDARYTDMADAGMVNLGQLVREAHQPGDVVVVGFGSHRGTVTASDRWGGPVRSTALPPARAGSTEDLLHSALEGPAGLFVFGDALPDWAAQERGHRAVGVVYRPDAERWGNYVPTVLGRRYGAFCWFDETRALDPLPGTDPRSPELETWPYGG